LFAGILASFFKEMKTVSINNWCICTWQKIFVALDDVRKWRKSAV